MGSRVSWKTYAGAASGVGSIKMIGVLVGVYHFDCIFRSANFADLIFTLATDTLGPTLTFSSADNGRGKTVNRYAIIKTIEPLDLLTHH